VSRRATPAIAAMATVATAGLLAATASGAGADSFTPVQLNIAVAPVARLHALLAIRVAVTADPGVLDGSEGPLRMEVKLAPECGGTFQTTPGTTLVNVPLAPQPATGRSYAGQVKGSGRPSAYGVQTVCAFLQDTDIGRVYANDESQQVTVSRSCTSAASRYDAAQRRLRRTRRAAVRRRLKRTVARERTRARRACGPGVAL
jgi:hypothetical protein